MCTTGFEGWVFAVYCILGIIMVGAYIIIDLLMIMSPGSFDQDEYILGAMNLYIDLVRVFVYILALLGSKK